MDILNNEGTILLTVDGDSLVGHLFDEVCLDYAVFDNLDLTGATFNNCSLYLASFNGAKLKNAKLIDCDFSNVADFAFEGANLTGVDFGVKVPVVKDLDKKICNILSKGKGNLEMDNWHEAGMISSEDPQEFVKTCGTTHCIAGWAITLAGAKGYELEKAFDPATAGAMIYAKSTGVIPDFYTDNETALEQLEARVEKNCAKE